MPSEKRPDIGLRPSNNPTPTDSPSYPSKAVESDWCEDRGCRGVFVVFVVLDVPPAASERPPEEKGMQEPEGME